MAEHEVHKTEEETSSTHEGTPKEQAPWEVRIAKLLVLIVFIGAVGSMVLAIFVSIYRGAIASPRVWKMSASTQQQALAMKPTRVLKCVKSLRVLDQEQFQRTRSLWFQMRNGHRGHLTLWQEWSRDWRRRLKALRSQCPMALRKGSVQGSTNRLKTLKQCRRKFNGLTRILNKKSDALWLNVRKGQTKQLQKWKSWSKRWERRIHTLVKQCPLNGRGEIAKSFHRASQKMLELQQQQERALVPFFSKSSDVFRDIRQSMHSLKEELR